MTNIFATYVSNGIKLIEIEKRSEYPVVLKKRISLLFEYAVGQHFFVYSFGAFVFSNIDQKTANKIIRKFGKALEVPIEKEFIEEYGYESVGVEKDAVEFDFVKVTTMSTDRLSLIADVLAQSVAIDYFDSLTDEISSRFDRINLELEKKGLLSITTRSLGKTIGTANTILQSIITRMALLDKPELIWEEAGLEAFYVSLRKMFELDDRFRIIEVKVDYIRNTSELALNMISNRKMIFLETMIVIFFVVDLLLIGIEIFVK